MAVLAKGARGVGYVFSVCHAGGCNCTVILVGSAILSCCVVFLFMAVYWWLAVNGMAQSSGPGQTGPSLAGQYDRYFALARFAYERDLSVSDKKYAMQVRDYVSRGASDTDGDGLLDNEERFLGTNPCLKDTDGDGLWDSTEIRLGLNPCSKDSRNDDVNDGQRDNDKDKYSNLDEQNGGYDPGSSNSSPDVSMPVNEYQSLNNGAVQWNSFQIRNSSESYSRRSHGHRRKSR